jgi:hypothetical protein
MAVRFVQDIAVHLVSGRGAWIGYYQAAGLRALEFVPRLGDDAGASHVVHLLRVIHPMAWTLRNLVMQFLTITDTDLSSRDISCGRT